jgi:hypothetical protein
MKPIKPMKAWMFKRVTLAPAYGVSTDRSVLIDHFKPRTPKREGLTVVRVEIREVPKKASICDQCGRAWSAQPCGPTHAAKKARKA